MDYNVVTQGAKGIISNFFRNPEGYELGLKTFYTEGAKNPSVARILFHNEAIKNARECYATQKRLSQEFDSFKPSGDRIKASDFKPKGFLAEMLATSAADLLNTIKEGYEILMHKNTKLFEMEVNRIRLVTSPNLLDCVAPENVQKEKEVFEAAFDTMYPKTGAIRKKLIKYNIRKDRVTPRFSKEKRHLLTEPKEGWFNKYPQTAGTRIEIMEGKKPEKPSLLTIIKNLFKSAETLAKEKEAKIEQQKKDYEKNKIAESFKP